MINDTNTDKYSGYYAVLIEKLIHTFFDCYWSLIDSCQSAEIVNSPLNIIKFQKYTLVSDNEQINAHRWLQ